MNTQRQNFAIKVLDESDLPPVFQGVLTATIPEDLGRGEEVLQVTAVDGDKGADREIRYSLTSSEIYPSHPTNISTSLLLRRWELLHN